MASVGLYRPGVSGGHDREALVVVVESPFRELPWVVTAVIDLGGPLLAGRGRADCICLVQARWDLWQHLESADDS